MGILQLILLIFTTGLALAREISKIQRSLPKQWPFSFPEPAGRLALPVRDLPPTLNVISTKEREMIEFQIEIEKLFHKNQLIPRIKGEFTAEEGLEAFMLSKNIKPELGFDLLTQMVLHKRCQLPVMVGILRRHYDGHPNQSQQTADQILLCVENDLADWNPVTRQLILKFEITPDVQEEIDRFQYPMPMVVEPRVLHKNTDTGYFTGSGSVILRHNHHDEDVCLDHLNRSNKIKLRLDMDTAQAIQNSWGNLDKPKPEEEYGEYQKRVRAFEKYDRTARDVLDHLGIATGGEFYLTHKYDKRGRTYCQGYHCTYQGPTWNKAVIAFANEEIVT